MSDKHETHAAVIAEMRECEGYRAYYDGGKHHDSYEESVVGVDYLRDFADRLEAAHKREIEDAERRGNHAAMGAVAETIQKVGPLYDAESIGNVAVLREAAETALKTIRGVINSTISPRSNTVFDCRDKLSAALAEPPRNCDLPNPEERYSEFCSRYQSCSYCPHDRPAELRCDGKWLLAPATEKEGCL